MVYSKLYSDQVKPLISIYDWYLEIFSSKKKWFTNVQKFFTNDFRCVPFFLAWRKSFPRWAREPRDQLTITNQRISKENLGGFCKITIFGSRHVFFPTKIPCNPEILPKNSFHHKCSLKKKRKGEPPDETVDGSEIRRSPVDMVFYPIIYRVLAPTQVVGLGIYGCHQQDVRLPIHPSHRSWTSWSTLWREAVGSVFF